jgi:signal transduction histidine kinase
MTSVEWFIPGKEGKDRSELSLERNFIFTHLCGPALAQAISIFLYLSSPHPTIECWICIICIWAFWTLPFVLKFTRSLSISAICSVELLSSSALFGSYNYGGVSSPFMPWLLISLLLGFFYLSGRPLLVLCMIGLNLLLFCAAFVIHGSFPEHMPRDKLNVVGSISIASAFIYMCWMAVYYARMSEMRSELQLEAERHLQTSARLQLAKDAADKANRGKSMFLTKMSHELRTPLNAVLGYSELLLEQEEGERNRKDRIADLSRINSAGRHLLSLVTDVLDLPKIEANTVELRLEATDLGKIAGEIAATVIPMATANATEIKVVCPLNIGHINTDETKLRQILLNLMSNAAKFTFHGTICLSLSRFCDASVDWIEIHVRDTGIGISPADLTRLFIDFGQATASISNTFGGTGLGLSISQHLCESLGGKITVESQVGKGSCFTVRLPANLKISEAH